jgi:hypothetical protein
MIKKKSAAHAMRGGLFMLAAAAAMAAWAVGLPDLELNILTGYLESVDAAPVGGRIQHVTDRGKGTTRTSALISTEPGLDPRLAIAGDGDSLVVWWTDAARDKVYCRIRDEASGAWGAERWISDPQVDSRSPEIIYEGGAAWVAYEADNGPSLSVIAMSIIDSPEPIPQVLATTTFTGNVDVLIHGDEGEVWVTWVDSSTEVGWSAYEPATETWSGAQFQSYVGIGTAAARQAIRVAVLGP